MPITGQDSKKIAEYADNAVWTAPLGTTQPTAPYNVSNPTATGSVYPSGWVNIGWLGDDSGIAEEQNVQNDKKYSSTGALVYELWSQLDEGVTFTAYEQNKAVLDLRDPNANKTVVTAAAAEVQTLTATGTPSAGAFGVMFGGSSASIAFNATSTVAQTAVRTLPGLSTATVTGSAGGPYVVTFPSALGDVALLIVDNSGLTGGTFAASETTPGVKAVYRWGKTAPGTLSPALRLWSIDMVKLGYPGWSERVIFVGRAAATDRGQAKRGATRDTAFRLSKITDDTTGEYEAILSTNPDRAPGIFL